MMEMKSHDDISSSNGNLQNNSADEVSFSAGNGPASAVRRSVGRVTRALCPCSLGSYKGELKELLKIAWPITLSSFMLQLIMMVSIVFCGHLGKDELNAVAISTTIVNVMGCSIALGLSTAFDTLLSQAYGSTNKKRVGILLQRGILILLLACLPCWAVFINTRNILRLLNLGPNVARLGQDFGTMAMVSLPGYVLFMCLSKYLQCQSIVYPSMIIGGIANLLNAGFHALFLFVFKMEVRGASLAVALSYWSMVAGHLLYIRVSRCYEKTWSGFQPYESLKEWGSFLHLAIPGMFMICLEWWGFEIMVVIAGILGPTPLAVHAVLYQFAAIMFMLPLGLSISASVRVGNFLGEGRPQEAKKSARAVMGLLWTGVAISITLLLSLRHILPYAYTEDHDVAALSTRIIPIVAIFHFCDATQGCASGILRGIGLQRFGAAINIIAYYVIGVPLGIPLMLKTYLGITGGWWAMLASTGFQSLSFLIRIALTDWLAESKRAIKRAHSGHPQTDAGNDEDSPRTLPSAVSSDDLISRDQLAPETGRRDSTLDLASATLADLEPNGTFVLEPDRSEKYESSHASLVVKRLVAVAILVAIFLAGVFCNQFVTHSQPSCFVINATELNATYLLSEIHDEEWFSGLNLADQQLVNETYKFEEDHFWNTTFLLCDGKIESVGNQSSTEYEGTVFNYKLPRILHRPVG